MTREVKVRVKVKVPNRSPFFALTNTPDLAT